jgi:hypothetical protein
VTAVGAVAAAVLNRVLAWVPGAALADTLGMAGTAVTPRPGRAKTVLAGVLVVASVEVLGAVLMEEAPAF